MKKLQILLILLLLPYLGFSQRLRPKMSPTDSLWGYANRDGRMVIDFKYDKAHYFNDDFAAVKKRGKWGLINKKGEVVINIKYEDIGTLKEGFVPVKKRGKWGLVDQNEKPNEKVQGYEELADFYPNPQLYYATKNGLKGMVDVDGKIHVPFQYDLVAPWEKGANVFVVFQDNKVGLLKSGGEPIIPVKYSLPIYYNPFRFDGDIAYFTEGTHFTLFDGNKWGVLDSYGKEIIPFDYDFIELFDDKKEYGKFQFALLIKDDKATLVGKDLKPVLDQELEYVYGFYGNNSNLLIIQFTDKSDSMMPISNN